MRQSTPLFRAALFGLCALFTACGSSQPAGRRGAIPVDAIPAILDAFRIYDVVALGDGAPRDAEGHDFRVALIRDPRFADTVNDIVVESANARYQSVVDEVNSSLPIARQIRVWVRDQNGDAAALLQQIVSKGRRPLVIYGPLQLVRRDPFDSRGPEGARSMVSWLERAAAMRVFTIWTHTFGGELTKLQADVESWPTPSLAMLSGTRLGGAEFAFYFPFDVFIDGRRARPLFGHRMEDQFNAILYLGQPVSQRSSG